ncbi:MAG TPA: glycosyltransferase family 4 protein [Terriglobales bacterium]|nr:glycosyltransferase family 4 protein [Terriglobales bacterium]
MTLRLVLITEIIAPYRVPVFNVLARQPGIDLHVIFLAETDPTQRQWLVPTDEIRFSFEVLPSWRRRVYGHNILLNWGVDESLRQSAPDVIICGGYNYIASWEAMRWSRRNGVPFLVWIESTTRDFRSGLALLRSLKTRFLRLCDGFVVAGKSSFQYVGSYAVPEARIFTAPNAVDVAFFSMTAEIARRDASQHRQRLNLPERYFLFVGRLEREKGIFDLVEAYEALPRDLRANVGLVFVGDGSARPGLEKRVAAVRPGAIHLPGFLQPESLAICYGLAETFVFPTHSDPWGLVINEAMACSLPVICSNAAGCAEDLVADGHNGRLFTPGDISRLSAAMHELAEDGQLRIAMGQASLRKIHDHSPEACAAGIADAALSCLEAKHA